MVFSNNQKLRFFEIFSCQNKLPNILGFFSKSSEKLVKKPSSFNFTKFFHQAFMLSVLRRI